MDIVNEIWKDIPEYKGYYQVSSLGRVRSLDRVVTCFKTTRERKGQIIKPKPDKNGYQNIDGVKTNNCPSNLEYCTAKSNTLHAYELGLCKKGEDHGRAKLKDSEVIEIRKMAERGISDMELSQIFNVSRGCIWFIRRNKSRQEA